MNCVGWGVWTVLLAAGSQKSPVNPKERERERDHEREGGREGV